MGIFSREFMHIQKPTTYSAGISALLNISNVRVDVDPGTSHRKAQPVPPTEKSVVRRSQGLETTLIPASELKSRRAQLASLTVSTDPIKDREVDRKTQSALNAYATQQNQPQKDEQESVSILLGVDIYV